MGLLQQALQSFGQKCRLPPPVPQGRSLVHLPCIRRQSPRRSRWFRVLGFSHPYARTHVELLGPCFKTGRLTPYLTGILHAMVMSWWARLLTPQGVDSPHLLGLLPPSRHGTLYPPGARTKQASCPVSLTLAGARWGEGASNYLSPTDH